MSVPATKPTQQMSPLAAMISARARQQQPARPPVSLTRFPAPPSAQPEILPPTIGDSDDLNVLYAGLQKSVESVRNGLVGVAYYGYRLQQRNAWPELGFENEAACRESVGLSERTWDRYIALGERLSQLTLQQMSKLTIGAAELLVKVHPQIWNEYSWVEEAALLPSREFAQLVDQRNQEVKPGAMIESTTRFTIKVGLSHLPRIERRMETLRKQRRLTSSAATLDYALDAADRERTLATRVANLEVQIGGLAKILHPDAPWSAALAEADSERETRLMAGAPNSLADAVVLTQRVTRRILRSLEAVHEVLPEASAANVESSSPAASNPEVR